MRALRIDPIARTVTELDLGHGLDALHQALAIDPAFSGTLDTVKLGDRQILFIDDEGMLGPGRAVFKLSGQPLAGVAILLDIGRDGTELPCTISVSVLEQNLEWTDLESSGEFEPSRIERIDHPERGRETLFIGGAAILRPRKAGNET